jgi:hypothetical protein
MKSPNGQNGRILIEKCPGGAGSAGGGIFAGLTAGTDQGKKSKFGLE